MKNFYEYLSDVKREYGYKIKLAVPVDDASMDRIEQILARYDAIEVSKPKKAILQFDTIDFPNLEAVETYTIRFITDRGLVTQSLVNDLKAALNIAESHIKVRGDNEPVEIQERFTNEFGEVDDEAGDLRRASLLGTDEMEEERDPSYGDEYNQKLLNYLAQVQANRAMEMDAVMEKSTFGFLHDLTAQEDAVFNVDHGGIRPVSGSTLDAKEATKPLDTAPTGNFDSRNSFASKYYKKSNGSIKKIESTSK